MSKERNDRPNQQLQQEQILVNKEHHEAMLSGYATLRGALRNCLDKVGIRSNPGWTDEDIVSAIEEKFELQDRDAYQRTKPFYGRRKDQD